MPTPSRARPRRGAGEISRLVELRDASSEDLETIVGIHLQAFPGFPLTDLGPRFLSQLYASFIRSPDGICLLALEADLPIAFLAGTLKPAGFFRRLLVRRFPRFVAAAIPALLRSPLRVGRKLASALFYRGDAPPRAGSGALLSSLAVRPTRARRGIGRALLEAFCDRARSAGSDFVFLTTDRNDNDRVRDFYLAAGFREEGSLRKAGGRWMSCYTLDLGPGSGRPRLAFLLPDLAAGGAQRVVLNLARGLAERGCRVDLVLASGHGPLLADVPELLEVVDLGAARALRSLPSLVAYLRRVRPAALLASLHLNVLALWARRLAGVPTRVIVSEHGAISSETEGPMMRFLNRRFYPWADRIVAVSRGVADDVARERGSSRASVEVVENAVVTRELREKARAELEHPWLRPGEPPVLLAVGRLTEEKDFETLLRALALVRRRRPVRLLILGEGDRRGALESLARQLALEADVGLPGFVPNPYPFMARAAAFVLSSRLEGLPTALIEALYCGAVAIATDCPWGPREILADGRYGQLVPVGDVDGLARAIETALERRGPRPPPESWHPFTEERVVDRYVRLLLNTPA